MPEVGGLEATREIMARAPRPIVIFCGMSEPASQRRAFEALEAGAVSIVAKPGPEQDLETVASELVRAVEVAAGVKLVGRGRRRQEASAPEPPTLRGGRGPVVAIGASTGGPQALLEVLRELPADFAPVLVVQHIVHGFVENMVSWLAAAVGHHVVLARHRQALEPGCVYFAPTEAHLVVRGGTLGVEDTEPRRGHRPSIDVLFESVAREVGSASVGVLLTGMGDDGARGLLAIREAGGDTIAQDEPTSMVFGMPRVAQELGAAQQVLPLAAIAAAIVRSPRIARH